MIDQEAILTQLQSLAYLWLGATFSAANGQGRWHRDVLPGWWDRQGERITNPLKYTTS